MFYPVPLNLLVDSKGNLSSMHPFVSIRFRIQMLPLLLERLYLRQPKTEVKVKIAENHYLYYRALNIAKRTALYRYL